MSGQLVAALWLIVPVVLVAMNLFLFGVKNGNPERYGKKNVTFSWCVMTYTLASFIPMLSVVGKQTLIPINHFSPSWRFEGGAAVLGLSALWFYMFLIAQLRVWRYRD